MMRAHYARARWIVKVAIVGILIAGAFGAGILGVHLAAWYGW